MNRVLAFTMSTESPGLSGELDLQDFKYFTLQMSTAWTASSISVLAASGEGKTYMPLHYQGAAQLLTVAVTQMYDLSTMGLDAVRFVKFQSTDAQAAARSMNLICKK